MRRCVVRAAHGGDGAPAQAEHSDRRRAGEAACSWLRLAWVWEGGLCRQLCAWEPCHATQHRCSLTTAAVCLCRQKSRICRARPFASGVSRTRPTTCRGSAARTSSRTWLCARSEMCVVLSGHGALTTPPARTRAAVHDIRHCDAPCARVSPCLDADGDGRTCDPLCGAIAPLQPCPCLSVAGMFTSRHRRTLARLYCPSILSASCVASAVACGKQPSLCAAPGAPTTSRASLARRHCVLGRH